MITNKYFYLLIGIFFMGVGIVAKADTYSKFETTKYYSKNQEFHVEVTPDKKAILYKNKKVIWTQILPELPRDFLVTNNGKRAIMVENYYGNKHDATKKVLIFFDENGQEVSNYNLENLADIKNVLHTTSSSHWLSEYKFNSEENEIIIDTVVLTCPLLERVSTDEDMKKVNECIKPKPFERILFSTVDGKILSRLKIENVQ